MTALAEFAMAQQLIAELDRFEEFAQEIDREPLEYSRRSLARTYREIIGVDPSQRAELRESLDAFLENPTGDVAAVVAWTRDNHPLNGSPVELPDVVV